MYVYLTGNCVPVNRRAKDMVCWIYQGTYDFGSGEMGYNPDNVTGGPIDEYNVFSPGEVGSRLIANSWKHAPWERYPHLL